MTELIFTLTYDSADPAAQDILGCDCCLQDVPTAEFKKPFDSHTRTWPEEKSRFCEVCASTLISNTFSYPSPETYERIAILRNLAACTNLILERLKKIEEKLGVAEKGTTP